MGAEDREDVGQTAEAVSSPPAPGPTSMISPVAGDSISTALSVPATAARRWPRGSSAGYTRTLTEPSTSRATPSSLTTKPSARACSRSSACSAAMPS